MKTKSLQFNLPLKIKKELFTRANNRCEECNSKVGLEAHHIKPKQKGIDHSLENLKLLCQECHSRKGISHRESKDRALVEIRVSFTEDEHKYLIRIKNKIHCKSWHNFFLAGAKELDVNGDEGE